MKKLLSFLMCVSLLSVGLFSCSSDDDEGGDDNSKRPSIHITVKATYDKDGTITPDAGSTVYLLEGFDANNPNGKWKYEGSGTFFSEAWGTRWSATKTASIGTDGTVKIANVKSEQGKPNENNFYTVVIESFAHKDDKNPSIPIGVFAIEKNNQILTYQYGGGITMGHE